MVLLDSLSSLSTQKNTPSGFTWEELQTVLAQAGFLEPLPSRQRQGISKDVRGKRKVRWFRRNGDPGMEPNPEAVYEVSNSCCIPARTPTHFFVSQLLLQIFERDTENKTVDLDPLRRLVSEPNAEPIGSPSTKPEADLPPIPGRESDDSPSLKGKTAAQAAAKRDVAESPPLEENRIEPPSRKREPVRGNSTDSTRSIARSFKQAAKYALQGHCHSDPDAWHLPQTKGAKNTSLKTPSSRLRHSSVVLNASSAQQYALEPRSSTDWPVMEIITLRFPTVKEPYFTVSPRLVLVVQSVNIHQASRLTVKAWASVDRRLIVPRAQTVIRIGEPRYKHDVSSSLNHTHTASQRPCRKCSGHEKNLSKPQMRVPGCTHSTEPRLSFHRHDLGEMVLGWRL